MEKSPESSEKAVIIQVPVTFTSSEYDRVVVSEIEQENPLIAKESLCSPQDSGGGSQQAEFSSSSIDGKPTQKGIKCGDENNEGGHCVISASNEVFKTAGPLQEQRMSYNGIQSSSLITEINNHSPSNSDVTRIVVEGDNDQQDAQNQVVDDQTEGQLQKDGENVYTNIPNLETTGSAHSNSTTYLTLDSICQLQGLTSHALLNTTELSSGLLDAGTHYIINTPQMQSLNAIQTMSQQGNGQIVLLQASSSQNENQVLVTHVSNANMQGNIEALPSSVQTTNPRLTEPLITKKPHMKSNSQRKSKRIKHGNSNPVLRPLIPRMVAVPMPSPLVIASSSASAQINASVPPMDQLQQLSAMPINQISRTTGQHFEVLGRCIVCFRFCRTTTYCRAEKNHTDVRAAACIDCETKGCSTVVCRRKRQHKGHNAYPPNIVINTALLRSTDLKEMCVKNLLPPCFSELHSLTVHHADCIFSQPRAKSDPDEQILTINGISNSDQISSRKPTDYARGYLYPYTKEVWEQWLRKFCTQTGTNYRIRTGKRVNKKSDHGLANHNGKIVVYRALESQLHNCALGGKPRKKAVREGSKRRKSRGSKLIGCPAVIHTRLIVTEENWKALEITVPKLSAHLPVHDPRITNPEIANDVNSMIYSDSLYDSEQGVSNQSQEEYAIIEDVGFHNDPETELTSEQVHFMNSVHVDNLKKQIRNLMSACGNVLNDVSSVEALKTIHLHVQTLYNELLPVSTQKRSRKRTADEASLIQEDEVLDEGESRADSVRQVVLLQSEQV